MVLKLFNNEYIKLTILSGEIMFHNYEWNSLLFTYNLNDSNFKRYVNPADVYIVPGYQIEVFAQDLESPSSIIFTDEGDLLVAESGYTSGNPRILKFMQDHFEVLYDDFNITITGINYRNGILYISHRGSVSRILKNGTRQIIIAGLPSNGDHYNSAVVIGPDQKLYLGQGTVTNSGVVGNDNDWVYTSPLLCDYPGDYIMLNGQNFETKSMLTDVPSDEIASTGAFSPYGTPNLPYEIRKGYVKASSSILRSNLDGTQLEQFAWGFRNPTFLKFDNSGRLFVSNNGYNARGSRPISNAPDEFFSVISGVWYGWPDYSGGEPVNLPRFRPEGGIQPEFLIKNQPNIPPSPFVTFPPNSSIRGFDFNYNKEFGPYGDVYITEYGSVDIGRNNDGISYAGIGHRISKIDMKSRTNSTFAINKSGFPASISKEGGFERLSDLVFGPDGGMYVLDRGINIPNSSNVFIPNTGVIWKITRNAS